MNRPGAIVLGGRSRVATLARAKQIVDLLSTCCVREGWKIDEAAAKRALEYCRLHAKDGSDPDDLRKAAIDFFYSHGQSLDWVFAAILVEWSADWRSILGAPRTSLAD